MSNSTELEQSIDTAPSISWGEAQKKFQELAESTKNVTFNVGTKDSPVPLTFKVKSLSQREKDKVDDAATKGMSGRGGEVKPNIGAAKNALIKYGVTEGPQGWTGSDTDIATLPADLRDELAESVNTFSNLDEDTRIGFL